ncbi:MAG: hypothetical protein ACYCYO_00430 [Bacilli bacterium]
MTKSYQTSQSIRNLMGCMKAYPVGFRGNPLNLLFIRDEFELIFNAKGYFGNHDGVSLIQAGNEIYVGQLEYWPFPTIEIPDRPPALIVSDLLFQKYELASKLLQRQSDLNTWIVDRATMRQADIVLLMIVDGLSYYDVEDDIGTEPVLVDGPTITQFGYRNVVGRPHISRMLFQVGYKQQRAFTYFPTDGDDLSDDIHETFGASQVSVVTEHSQIIDKLMLNELSHGYVQIVGPGLDHLSHNHRDRPLKQEYVRNIMLNFSKVVEVLGRTGKRVLGCLTADHGILWRDDLPHVPNIVDVTVDDSYHPRYLKGSYRRDYSWIVDSFLGNYSLLKYPYLTRNLRRTEWGVHGGLSAWESLVPLVHLELNY